ncbi:hypothetical protein KAFR_0B03630 [Kazachstania africana CBS 2517]|uniref:adenosylmethionine decarboxylase n=1 Tax=Kazachstania africana (strain ATCC 22294 / BCRC 22015 / CBS 2517 / CECT 1963 / NBRC 1671 / NRRL Y-8276) TaxID=1071382 RepID=H2AQL0_KAZAF|nr:hypothetical protein KAFR_0B03630 [Kazachstania africana CBS 2517]CCF56660.1 hypothetical protein KAFR_0B03630 [Kazachstania africana CBS 2517]
MTVTIKELTNHSYIDHELSATLDSTEAFEGPEKLLEIWFYPNKTAIPVPKAKTLRSIAVEKWVHILKLVKCDVLSIKSTDTMDAFLLSESSLFVYDHKITLKTCGTTTTLFCLEELFNVIEHELDWDLKHEDKKYFPYKVFYSRRCFMFPLKQRSIHKNWNDEVDYLNKFFCYGKSYMVGRNNQDDHWNLYVSDTRKDMQSEENAENENDETLEILMTGLDPACADKFVCNREVKDVVFSENNDNKSNDDADDEGHLLGYNMTKKTRLDKVYETDSNVSFHHDAFAFSPCGYSSNIILQNEYYYTLHVTPEKGWSYASFESNVPVSLLAQQTGKEQDNIDVFGRVLDVFKPKDLCLTFFAKSMSNPSFQKLMKMSKNSIPHYKKMDRIIYDLDDYQLLYYKFQREEDVDGKI